METRKLGREKTKWKKMREQWKVREAVTTDAWKIMTDTS